jgi:hypothetical protein
MKEGRPVPIDKFMRGQMQSYMDNIDPPDDIQPERKG